MVVLILAHSYHTVNGATRGYKVKDSGEDGGQSGFVGGFGTGKDDGFSFNFPDFPDFFDRSGNDDGFNFGFPNVFPGERSKNGSAVYSFPASTFPLDSFEGDGERSAPQKPGYSSPGSQPLRSAQGNMGNHRGGSREPISKLYDDWSPDDESYGSKSKQSASFPNDYDDTSDDDDDDDDDDSAPFSSPISNPKPSSRPSPTGYPRKTPLFQNTKPNYNPSLKSYYKTVRPATKLTNNLFHRGAHPGGATSNSKVRLYQPGLGDDHSGPNTSPFFSKNPYNRRESKGNAAAGASPFPSFSAKDWASFRPSPPDNYRNSLPDNQDFSYDFSTKVHQRAKIDTTPENLDRSCIKNNKTVNARTRFSKKIMECYTCRDNITGASYEQCSEKLGGSTSEENDDGSIAVPRNKRHTNNHTEELPEREKRQYEYYDGPDEHNYGTEYNKDYRFGPEHFSEDPPSYQEPMSDDFDKEDNEKCFKSRKGDMLCISCENLKTGGTYEQCSYASDPKKNSYERSVSKVYGSPRNSDENRRKPLEPSGEERSHNSANRETEYNDGGRGYSGNGESSSRNRGSHRSGGGRRPNKSRPTDYSSYHDDPRVNKHPSSHYKDSGYRGQHRGDHSGYGSSEIPSSRNTGSRHQPNRPGSRQHNPSHPPESGHHRKERKQYDSSIHPSRKQHSHPGRPSGRSRSGSKNGAEPVEENGEKERNWRASPKNSAPAANRAYTTPSSDDADPYYDIPDPYSPDVVSVDLGYDDDDDDDFGPDEDDDDDDDEDIPGSKGFRAGGNRKTFGSFDPGYDQAFASLFPEISNSDPMSIAPPVDYDEYDYGGSADRRNGQAIMPTNVYNKSAEFGQKDASRRKSDVKNMSLMKNNTIPASCKKVKKNEMTCYQCVDKNGTRHEECTYFAGSEPKSKQVSYREIKELRFEPHGDRANNSKSNPKSHSMQQQNSNHKQEQATSRGKRKFKKYMPEESNKSFIDKDTGGGDPLFRPRREGQLQDEKIPDVNSLQKSDQEGKQSVVHRNEAHPDDSSENHVERTDREVKTQTRKNYNPIPTEPPELEDIADKIGPEGEYSADTESVFDPVLGLSLPKYMLEKSEHEAAFDEVLASG